MKNEGRGKKDEGRSSIIHRLSSIIEEGGGEKVMKKVFNFAPLRLILRLGGCKGGEKMKREKVRKWESGQVSRK